jgi:hypothetical protein
MRWLVQARSRCFHERKPHVSFSLDRAPRHCLLGVPANIGNNLLDQADVAMMPSANDEFTVQDIVSTLADLLEKPFSSASAGMMMKTLTELGFVLEIGGAYILSLFPLHNEFIVRQMGLSANLPAPFGTSAS